MPASFFCETENTKKNKPFKQETALFRQGYYIKMFSYNKYLKLYKIIQ